MSLNIGGVMSKLSSKRCRNYILDIWVSQEIPCLIWGPNKQKFNEKELDLNHDYPVDIVMNCSVYLLFAGFIIGGSEIME